jgi:hypothetical protein
MKLVSILLRFVFKMGLGEKEDLYLYKRTKYVHGNTSHHPLSTRFSPRQPLFHSNAPLYIQTTNYFYTDTYTHTHIHTYIHFLTSISLQSHLTSTTYPSTMKFLFAYIALFFPVTILALGNAVILNSSPHTIYAWSVGAAISARQIIVPGTSLPPYPSYITFHSNKPNRRPLPRAPAQRPTLGRHRAQTHNHTRRFARRESAADLRVQCRRRQGVV